MEWFAFLMKQNLAVILIDSFADPRPRSSCIPPWFAKSEIYRIRHKQANYALSQLRLDYPGKRIFIWGHSEGGGVANLIDERVDGIITTGYHCGFSLSASTRVRKDVPFLVLIGAEDAYVPGPVRLSGYGTVEALCKRAMDSPNWKYLIIGGEGHRISLRNKRMREAITEFLRRPGARPPLNAGPGPDMGDSRAR